MKVEGFSLHIYCDNKSAHLTRQMVHEFAGVNKKDCHKQARKRGWVIGYRDLCPSCGKPESKE